MASDKQNSYQYKVMKLQQTSRIVQKQPNFFFKKKKPSHIKPNNESLRDLISIISYLKCNRICNTSMKDQGNITSE